MRERTTDTLGVEGHECVRADTYQVKKQGERKQTYQSTPNIWVFPALQPAPIFFNYVHIVRTRYLP